APPPGSAQAPSRISMTGMARSGMTEKHGVSGPSAGPADRRAACTGMRARLRSADFVNSFTFSAVSRANHSNDLARQYWRLQAMRFYGLALLAGAAVLSACGGGEKKADTTAQAPATGAAPAAPATGAAPAAGALAPMPATGDTVTIKMIGD